MRRPRIPRPRSTATAVRLLRWIWTFPTNLIGHMVGLVVCRRRPLALTSPAGAGWLYLLPGRLGGRGAVTLGHTVLAGRSMISGERGRWILAHELAHARQHDWLGPAYLPLHLLCQAVSAILALICPKPGFTPWHAYNPLERVFLCVPYDVLVAAGPPRPDEAAVLEAFHIDRLDDRDA